MRIIFGTTNKRKVSDLMKVINDLKLDIEVLSLNDINWNLGEIEEDGNTIEENSLIKAEAIHKFSIEHNLHYPIVTDDSGLFVYALNGEPGIYTARYADEELKKDNTLPEYYGVIKLLNNLEGVTNRDAIYKCSVTCMLPDGTYFQELEVTEGLIDNKTNSEIKKPYLYSIFVVKEYMKVLNELNEAELKNTFRFKALKKILTKI